MSNSRRDFLKLGASLLLAGAASSLLRAQADQPASSVFSRGLSRLPKVALTYDDCYLVTVLQKLEKLLDAFPNVRVTFFPVGEALLSTDGKDPGIWKRFFERGHEIGYHSFHHDNLQLFKTEAVIADYDRWYEALIKVLGKEAPVHFARPPFGNVSPPFLEMCAARGQVATMWSWGWGGTLLEDTVKYTIPKTKNGDIVLLHTRTFDIDASSAGLPWLASQGMQAVTLRQLYYDYRKDQAESKGCETTTGASLTRTCID
ncbi:MAG: polysaccharide deacetylase family protein [Chloroflexota bacterium]